MILRSFTNINLFVAISAAIVLLVLFGFDPKVLEFRNSRILDGIMIGIAAIVLTRLFVDSNMLPRNGNDDTYEELYSELSAIRSELRELRLRIDRRT